MELAIDELYKSRKYHDRQIGEHLLDIQNKETGIKLLKGSITKHEETIKQIDRLIEIAKRTE